MLNNNITNFKHIRRNVNFLTIHGNMTMTNNLTGLTTGSGQTHTEDHIIQTAFQQNQQICAGYAIHLLCFVIVAAELTLQNAIDKLSFLFLSQLQTIFTFLLAKTARLPFGLFIHSQKLRCQAQTSAALQHRSLI